MISMALALSIFGSIISLISLGLAVFLFIRLEVALRTKAVASEDWHPTEIEGTIANMASLSDDDEDDELSDEDLKI